MICVLVLLLSKLIVNERSERMEWKQTTIRLPVELKEQIQQEADRRGTTLHDFIVFILWEDSQHTVLE